MKSNRSVLGCVAEAKYRKYANSSTELKRGFKDAVSAAGVKPGGMTVETELEGYIKMTQNFPSYLLDRLKEEDPVLKRITTKLFPTHGRPMTMDDFFEQIRGSVVFSIEMLAHYDNGYVLDAKCVPFLVIQIDRHHVSESQVSQTDIDLAYAESARFVESIFIGGMGSERVVAVHPYEAKVAHHEFLVNVSKSRNQLSDKLMMELKNAKKSVRSCGWIGRHILPELKACSSRGIELRIITKRPQESNKGLPDKSDAFNDLRQFVSPDNVRLLSSCHARLVIIDTRVVFVGSMDLDSESLAERDEAAISSEDTEVVSRASGFFDELFEKGTRPDWKTLS